MEQLLSNNSKGILTGMSPYDLPVIDENDINACCRRRERLGGRGRRLRMDLPRIIAIARPRTDKAHATQISPLGGTAKYISKERRRLLGARFVDIQTLMNTIAATHGNEIEIWQQMARIRKGFKELQASMLKHLFFERDFLFPWIASDSDARLSPAGAMKTLERQHSKIAIMIKAMIARTGRLLNRPEACDGQQALYKALVSFNLEVKNHIQMEHIVLFPQILKKSVEQLAERAGQ